ncbi:chemotaxis response regulator CheB [Oxalobacteraceae bacterium GrIS 2.11]
MIRRDIVVIGASTGGVEALKALIAELPVTLPDAIFIVLHRASHIPDMLISVLERAGSLPVSCPKDGDPIVSGHIYLASPGKHLIVEKDRIQLLNGSKENLHCPAIDVLFRSAAAAFGPRVIGIVLSGYLNDGTAGLRAVKDHGGIALVQSPEEAQVKSMPMNAIQNVFVDQVLPVAEIANEIIRLVRQPLSS